MSSFNFVGKLRSVKEGYSTETYNSSIVNRLSFRMVCGNDTHFLRSNAWDNTGKVLKVRNRDNQPVDVPWDSRYDEEILKTISHFSTYSIDMDPEGEPVPEGQTRKKLTFLDQNEFIQNLRKLLDSDKYKNRYFRVRGEIERNYGIAKNAYYTEFKPRFITIMPEGYSEGSSNARIECYYTNDDIVEPMEKGDDLVLKFHERFYNRADKKYYFAPVTLIAKEGYKFATDALVKWLKKAPATDEIGTTEVVGGKGANVKQCALMVEVRDGARPEGVQTLDQASEDTQWLVKAGLCTEEEVTNELNSNTVYGDRVTENVITGIAQGYLLKGPEATAYTVEDLTTAPGVEVKKDTSKEEILDIFASSSKVSGQNLSESLNEDIDDIF